MQTETPPRAAFEVKLEKKEYVAAALIGLVILLVLIIKFKIQAMVAILIGAIAIGLIAGMPFGDIINAVNDGIGNTLKGIALLVGLGSMFGAILETSGGAQSIAVTMVKKFGDEKAAWALGITGLDYPDSSGIFSGKENEKIFSVLCDSASGRTGCRPCLYSADTGTGSGGNHAECRAWMGDFSRYSVWYGCHDCGRSCIRRILRKKI